MSENTVPEETKSPYSEPLQRPHSARESPRPKSEDKTKASNKSTKQQRAKSAKSPSRSASQKKKKGRHKHVDEEEREIQMVSKEVRRKLELYLNKEKRETRFNPDGYITTTRKMAPLDLAYRIMEYEKMEKISPRNPKSKMYKEQNNNRSSKDPYTIEPKLLNNSRRMTQYAEADRYSKYASEVFASYPIEKLAVIHRYRPHPKEQQKKSAENGNILGYTGHVGAALHQKAYVDFYIKEGFNAKSFERPSSRSSSKKSESGNKSNLDRRTSSASTATSTRSNRSNAKLEPIDKTKKSKQCDSNTNKPNKETADKPNKETTDNKEQNKEQEHTNQPVKDNANEAEDVMNGNEKLQNSPDPKDKNGMTSVTSSHASLKSASHGGSSRKAHKSASHCTSSSSSSSSDDEKDDDDENKPKKKKKRKAKNTVPNHDISNKSKESLNKTWEYYEQKNAKDPDSEEEQVLYNDKEDNKNHMSDNIRTEEDGTDKAHGYDENDSSSPSKSEVGKTEGDNKSMRSYVSVEHVLEVDIKDI